MRIYVKELNGSYFLPIGGMMQSSTNGIYNWQIITKKTGIFLLFAGLINISCSENPQPPAEEPTQTKLFQTQREALEKAKAVELAAKKQAEETQQQIEQQTK